MDHSLTLESLTGYGDEQVVSLYGDGSGFESHVVSLVIT